MNISIISKNTSVRDPFRERCEKKLAKLDRFFGDDAKATVTVTNQNGRETVEATITAGGMFFRAEKTTSDRLDSLEAVVDALTKQITRNKKKLEHKFHPAKFAELAVDFYEEPDEQYGVVKTKQFKVVPMDIQEAILQMNMLDVLFINLEERIGIFIYEQDITCITADTHIAAAVFHFIVEDAEILNAV